MIKNPVCRETMEDEHLCIDNFNNSPQSAFFAVYDGHGGIEVAEFVAGTLHQKLIDELKNYEKPTIEDISKSITTAHLKTDQLIIDQPIKVSGATSCMALVSIDPYTAERWLHVANIGDARAVLCRNGKAERLSYDHKATDELEIKRITEAKGLLVLGRVGGSLAVSRAFGDIDLKKWGLCADPYISQTLLLPTDTFLIVACDGLWDVATDQQAVDVLIGETNPQKMSEKLLYYALDHGTKDNVTIIVVNL